VRNRTETIGGKAAVPGGASKKSCTQVRDFYLLLHTSSLLPQMAGFFGK